MPTKLTVLRFDLWLSIVVATALSVAVGGCSPDRASGARSNDSGSCPAELDFHGSVYVRTRSDGPLTRTGHSQDATFTICARGTVDEDRKVHVWRLPGLALSDGFAAELGGELFLYVARHEQNACSLKYVACDATPPP